ncbi:MAG: MerR family transcriptional regulator [Calditrichaeota bacterium]|nr:MAG: MerR family transcriptional regulator [Calditrichota bacterium]
MKNSMWLSSSDVTRKLNISLRQLYYWELKGIVKPRMITMGSREFKRYSTHDFNILKQIKDYLDQGYTLSSAVQRVQDAVNR